MIVSPRVILLLVVASSMLTTNHCPALIVTNYQTNTYNIYANSSPGSNGLYFSYDILTNSFSRWSGPGTLTSVEITILGRNTGTFLAPGVTVTSAVAQQNFTFIGGGAPSSIFSSAYNLTTDPGPLPQTYIGMFNLPDGPNDWLLNGTTNYTDTVLLSSYFSGAGNFELRLSNLLLVSASSGTIYGNGLISTGDVVVKMTAVPEPSAYALLGLSALALRFISRRRH